MSFIDIVLPYTVGYGDRIDGTRKGPGFATFYTPRGDVVTEFSLGGKDFLYPMVYENIPPWDLRTIQNVISYGYDPLDNEVMQRAYESAIVRRMQGKSPFWTTQDAPTGVLYTPINWNR